MYEPISTVTLSSVTTEINFTSIPSTYTDLRIIFNQFSAPSLNSYFSMQFNGDTGSNYSIVRLYSSGTQGAQASANSVDISPGLAVWSSSTRPMLIEANIMSYASSVYKLTLCSVTQDNNGSGWVARTASTWRNNSAVSSIRIYDGSGLNGFGVGTIATLFGIKAA